MEHADSIISSEDAPMGLHIGGAAANVSDAPDPAPPRPDTPSQVASVITNAPVNETGARSREIIRVEVEPSLISDRSTIRRQRPEQNLDPERTRFVNELEGLIYTAEDLGTQRDLARGIYSIIQRERTSAATAGIHSAAQVFEEETKASGNPPMNEPRPPRPFMYEDGFSGGNQGIPPGSFAEGPANDSAGQPAGAPGPFVPGTSHAPAYPPFGQSYMMFGDAPLVLNALPQKFENKDDFPWEEYESALIGVCEGRNEASKISLLQQSLGKGPRGWYNLRKQLKYKPFAEQIEAFRQEYSRRDPEDNVENPPNIYMKAGENVHDFQNRILRLYMHLAPMVPKANPKDTDAQRNQKMNEYHFKFREHDKKMRDNFIHGLPAKYHKTILRQRPRPNSFEAAYDIAKRMWRIDQQVKTAETEAVVSQARQYNQDLAVTYLGMKAEDASDESDASEEALNDETPTFVHFAERLQQKPKAKGILKKPAAEQPKNTEKSKKEAIVSKQIEKEKTTKGLIQQLQGLQATLVSLEQKNQNLEKNFHDKLEKTGNDMTERMRDMLTKDAKPTAKAGTKGDPLTEDAEKEIKKPRPKCDYCGRFGHWAADCRKRLETSQKKPVQGRGNNKPKQTNGNNQQKKSNDQNKSEKESKKSNQGDKKWQAVNKNITEMQATMSTVADSVKQSVQVMTALTAKLDSKN